MCCTDLPSCYVAMSRKISWLYAEKEDGAGGPGPVD